jgi:hypothetical protein
MAALGFLPHGLSFCLRMLVLCSINPHRSPLFYELLLVIVADLGLQQYHLIITFWGIANQVRQERVIPNARVTHAFLKAHQKLNFGSKHLFLSALSMETCLFFHMRYSKVS